MEPIPEDETPHTKAEDIIESQPKYLGVVIVQSIKKKIQDLPTPYWVKISMSKIYAVGRLVYFGFKFRGNPIAFYEVKEDGTLFTTDPLQDRYNLWSVLGNLEEKHGSKGTIWVLKPIEYLEVIDDEGNELAYGIYYFSPRRAIEKSLAGSTAAQEKSEPQGDRRIRKRSNVLQKIEESSAKDPAQDPAAVFQQYFDALLTVQTGIGTLIAPVLNNVTSHTNSSLIHQMAQSTYYDLTGSTTALIGPFNYGMSFLGNISNATTANLIGQTANNTEGLYTMLGKIYAAIWVEAMMAANSTSLLAEQRYLASCLYTNTTSVYPPGFTDVRKGG